MAASASSWRQRIRSGSAHLRQASGRAQQAVSTVLLLVAIACTSATSTFVGTIRTSTSSEAAMLVIDEGASPSGGLILGSGDAGAMILSRVTFSANDISFQINEGGVPITCRAEIRNGVLLSRTTERGCQLNMVATEPYSEKETAAISGLYRLADGRLMDIAPTFLSGPPVYVRDYRGLLRALYYRGRGEFTAGPGMIDPAPTALAIETAQTGRAIYVREGGRRIKGERVSFRERPFAWTNGDANLSGSLILPAGKGPFPAVILTQWADPVGRDHYRSIAHWYAAKGIAALIYDRRGVRESTGDTRTTGFPELAEDAAQAARALEKLPEIDAKRIGAEGGSQGGWIAPLAAARSSAISWVVVDASPAVTAAEQEMWRVEHQARAENYSEAELKKATEYEAMLIHWIDTGEGRNELIERAKTANGQRWAANLHLIDETSPERVADARREKFWFFDPLPEYRKIKVPILVMNGELDAQVPAEKSVRLWREALAGNRNAEVILFPRTTHEMWIGDRESTSEMMRSPGENPAFWPTIEKFLIRNHFM